MGTKAKKNLRVLHGPGGSAGQPSCLSKAQSEIGITAHSMRLGNNKYEFQADLIYPVDGPSSYCEAFSKLADKYDVFHFYFRPFFYDSYYCGYPMGFDILALRAAGKAVLMHFRGSEIRLHSLFNNLSPYNYVLEDPNNIISKFPEDSQKNYIELMRAVCNEVMVPDPELQSYCPEARIVPRAIDLSKWPFVGVSRSPDPPLIVHAPSRRTVKGTEILLSALDQLRGQGFRFQLQLVENMSHAEAMEIYRRADIIVDQLRIGWYGVLSVEAMALGKPVLSYIRDDLKRHLSDPPFVMTSPETIARDMKKLLSDVEFRKGLAIRARNYAEKVHDSKKIASQLVEIYRDCLENPRPIDFERLGYFIDTHPYYMNYSKFKERYLRGRNLFSRVISSYHREGLKKTARKIFMRIKGGE